jgi:hypothetical protein
MNHVESRPEAGDGDCPFENLPRTRPVTIRDVL